MRILIVEDNVRTSESMRELMMMKGHAVRLARTVEEGQVLLNTRRVDVALVDWWLEPGDPGNGAELIRWARMQGIDTPCVMLTGMTDKSVTESVMADLASLPGTSFLHKPVDPDALLVAMKEMLKDRQLVECPEGVPDSWLDA